MIAPSAVSQLVGALRSRLFRQSAVYMLGQVLQRAVAFLLVPVWTAFLTPEDYGITGTLSAYGQISHILLTVGIYGAVMRAYFDYRGDPEIQKSYIFSNFLFLLICPICIISFCMLFGKPWWEHITNGSIPFAPFAVLTLISVWGGLIYRMLYSLWQTQQQVKTCVTAEFAIFLVTNGISLFLVAAWQKGAYGQLLGGAATQAVAGLVASTMLFKQWYTKRIHWSYVKASLVFGLPLVPHLLSHWILSFADRVMLTTYVPLKDVGLYNLGYNLGMIMLVVVTGINEAFQPYYFDLMSSGSDPHRKIIRIVSAYMVGVGVVALFGSLFAQELIAILTPPKYQGAAKYVPPVLLGYLFVGLYFFASSPLFFYKKTKLLPLITAVGATLNIGLNLALIPRFGAVASAWNTLGSYILLLILYYSVAQRVDRIAYPTIRYILLLLLLIVAVLAAELIPPMSISGTILKVTMCATYAGCAYILVLHDSVTGGGTTIPNVPAREFPRASAIVLEHD